MGGKPHAEYGQGVDVLGDRATEKLGVALCSLQPRQSPTPVRDDICDDSNSVYKLNDNDFSISILL